MTHSRQASLLGSIGQIESSTLSAYAFITAYGKPSADLNKLITRQMRGFAFQYGSQEAARLAGMITTWNIQQPLRERIQKIQAKYDSFRPFSTTDTFIDIDHYDDISLLIRESYEHPDEDPLVQEDFDSKITKAMALHSLRFQNLGEEIYILSYQSIRDLARSHAEATQRRVRPSLIGSIEAGLAVGCVTLYAASAPLARTDMYDSVNTHCPLTNALTEIIENPSNAKACDAGRFALSFIYKDIYKSSHDGEDCIEAIAHNRKESGARRIAAMQALENAYQKSPWMRLYKLVRPKAYAACITGKPAAIPR